MKCEGCEKGWPVVRIDSAGSSWHEDPQDARWPLVMCLAQCTREITHIVSMRELTLSRDSISWLANQLETMARQLHDAGTMPRYLRLTFTDQMDVETTDTTLINWLERQLAKRSYTGRCLFRWSTEGRGFRLHETSEDGAKPTVREALIDAIRRFGR